MKAILTITCLCEEQLATFLWDTSFLGDPESLRYRRINQIVTDHYEACSYFNRYGQRSASENTPLDGAPGT